MGPEWLAVIFFLAIPILCGVATSAIAASKGWVSGQERFLWGLLGFLLPLIGIIIASIVGPKTPAPTTSGSAPPPPPPQMPG